MNDEQLKALSELNSLIETNPEYFSSTQLDTIKELSSLTLPEEPQFKPYSPTVSPESIQPVDVRPVSTDVEQILQRSDEVDSVGDVWTRGFKNAGTALGNAVNIIPTIIQNTDQTGMFKNMPEGLKKNLTTDDQREKYLKEKADDIVNYFSEIEAKPATGRFTKSPESIFGYLDPKRMYTVFAENAPLMGGMVATTIANPVAGALLMGAVEGGQTKSTILDYEEETGKRVPEHLRKSIPLIVGSINASLERTGINRILKGFPGLKNRIASVLLTSTTEGTTEALQGLNQQIAEQLTQEEKEVFKDFDWSQLGQEFYAGLVLGAGSSSISEISGIPQSKADEKFKVSKIGIEIERAKNTGDFENITLDMAERFAKQNPEAFENNSALQFISEVRKITRETLKAKGENPDKFFTGEGLEANTKEAQVLGSTLEENGQVLINLYKGARPDTVIEEFYGNAYRNLSAEEKSIWEDYYAEKVREGETLTKQELFEKEGTQYYFDEGLYKNSTIAKVLQRIKQFLNDIVGRSNLDPKIRKMWEDAGYAKVGEGATSKDESFQLAEFKQNSGYVDSGKEFKTGQKVVFSYAHNKTKSPYFGKKYQQDIEPFGKYMTLRPNDHNLENYEYGTQTFNNPLVIENGLYGREGAGWKKLLSDKYKQTGKGLTDALIKDGYDGIITTREGNASEILALIPSSADESFQLTVEDVAKQVKERKVRSGSEVKYGTIKGYKEIIETLSDPEFDMEGSFDWYRGKVKKSKDIASLEVPEIKSDPEVERLFEIILGMTSLGTKISPNYNSSIPVLQHYLKNGEFNIVKNIKGNNLIETENADGKTVRLRRPAIAEMAIKLDNLIKKMGRKEALEWIFSPHSAKEVKEMNNGKGAHITGVADPSKQYYGASIFGPKIGRYIMNLHGVHEEAVFDLWWTRTWHRWMGTPFHTSGMNKGKLKEAPQGNPEIAKMDAVINNLVTSLSKKTGYEWAPDQVQAVLWYYEKELYKRLGSPQEKGLNYTDVAIERAKKKGYYEQFTTSQDTEVVGDPQGVGGSVEGEPTQVDRSSEGRISETGSRDRETDTQEVTPKDESFQITAFHGSPYKFNQFDSSQIGSGEGNQAFGHGLYFSSKEDIAKHYLPFKESPDDSFLSLINEVPEKTGSLYRVTLHKGKDPSEYDYMSWVDKITPKQFLKIKNILTKAKGEIEKESDSETKEKILNNINKLNDSLDRIDMRSPSWRARGEYVYRAIEEILGPESASGILLEAGIDGIRYPAQGGTGGRFGDSENFVVFDDSAVTIDKQESFQLSPQQKEHFKDTKVVNEDGTPRVVYHGTNEQFDKFYPGSYFTSSPEYASDMAMEHRFEVGENVKPVYLNIKNPKRYRTDDEYEDFVMSSPTMGRNLDELIEQGYDGIIFEPQDGGEDVIVAFNPEQIKSVWNTDPASTGESFQLAPKIMPSDTRMEALKRNVQDKLQRLEKAQKIINVKDEEMDAYLESELYLSRVRARLDDMENDLNNFLRDLSKTDTTLDDLGMYLYAQHAGERDAEIKKRKPDLKFDASGWDAEKLGTPKSYMVGGKNYKKGSKALAIRFRNEIVEKRLDVLLSGGLITQKTYDLFKSGKVYKNYVPLKGLASGEVFSGAGKGFQLTGKDIIGAGGRQSFADNPAMQSINDLDNSIIRSEKNIVNQALYRLIEANPLNNPDGTKYWEVKEIPQIPRFDENGDINYFEPKSINPTKEMIVFFKGKAKKIVINDPLLYDNLNSIGAGKTAKTLSVLNNLMRNAYTTVSPTFWLTNFQRDAGMNFLINVMEDRPDIAVKTAKNIGPAKVGITKALAGGKGKWVDIYNDFVEQGGKMGWIESQTLEERKANLENKIKRMQKPSQLKDGFKLIASAIEGVNTVFESSTRLATYKALLDSGYSKKRASQIAKNITVNFNKKGAKGGFFNSLWLFWNAGIQGNFNSAKNSVPIKGDSSKRFLKKLGFISALMGTGYMVAKMLRSDDEEQYDRMSDYQRFTKLMIPYGDGQYFPIQLPYGFNFYYALGVLLEEMENGDLEPSEGAIKGLHAFTTTFNPFQGADLIDAMTPTLAKPAEQILRNIKYTGGYIRPDNKNNPVPPSENYYDSANPFNIAWTKKLNEFTGGTPLRAGSIGPIPTSINPENVDHIIDFLGPLVNVGFDAITGQEVNSSQISKLWKVSTENKYKAKKEVDALLRKSKTRRLSLTEYNRFERYLDLAIKDGTIYEDEREGLELELDKHQEKVLMPLDKANLYKEVERGIRHFTQQGYTIEEIDDFYNLVDKAYDEEVITKRKYKILTNKLEKAEERLEGNN